SFRFADAARRARADYDSCWLVCDALDQLGRNDEAVQFADQCRSLARTDEQRALAAIRRSQLSARAHAGQDHAIELVVETLAQVTEPLWQAALTIQHANLLLHGARLAEAIAVIEPVVEASDATVVEAVVVLGPALAVSGRADAAVALAERGQSLLANHPIDLAVGDDAMFDVVRALGLIEAGRIELGQEVAEAAYLEGARVSDRWRQGWFALLLARAALLAGDLPAAAARFRESAFAFGTLDHPGYRAWGLAGLAGSVAQFGSQGDAEALAASFDQLPAHDVRFFEPDAGRMRAWVDVAANRLPAAEVRFRHAAATAEATGQLACEAAVYHDLARCGLATVGDGKRSAELAAIAEGALVRARDGYVQAVIKACPDELSAAAERFENLGMTLFAAEAWCGAAAAAAAAGDVRSSRAAARQANAALSRCSGVHTPALASVTDVRLRDRELEIARLAASGVSRRDIAARTYLSVRTVDRHLNEAFTKLGIRSREELPEALADLDDLPGS
ncbi:MAG TPA: helix-turn-helix transcriptional regulator, partial [Acidimicrobiales bacterium]